MPGLVVLLSIAIALAAIELERRRRRGARPLRTLVRHPAGGLAPAVGGNRQLDDDGCRRRFFDHHRCALADGGAVLAARAAQLHERPREPVGARRLPRRVRLLRSGVAHGTWRRRVVRSRYRRSHCDHSGAGRSRVPDLLHSPYRDVDPGFGDCRADCTRDDRCDPRAAAGAEDCKQKRWSCQRSRARSAGVDSPGRAADRLPAAGALRRTGQLRAQARAARSHGATSRRLCRQGRTTPVGFRWRGADAVDDRRHLERGLQLQHVSGPCARSGVRRRATHRDRDEGTLPGRQRHRNGLQHAQLHHRNPLRAGRLRRGRPLLLPSGAATIPPTAHVPSSSCSKWPSTTVLPSRR